MRALKRGARENYDGLVYSLVECEWLLSMGISLWIVDQDPGGRFDIPLGKNN